MGNMLKGKALLPPTKVEYRIKGQVVWYGTVEEWLAQQKDQKDQTVGPAVAVAPPKLSTEAQTKQEDSVNVWLASASDYQKAVMYDQLRQEKWSEERAATVKAKSRGQQ